MRQRSRSAPTPALAASRSRACSKPSTAWSAGARGIPRDADLIFDVRFLDNPHYVPALQPLTGRDREVAAHIEQDPDCELFFARLWRLLDPLLPRYETEGKTYLTIGIGCTGGRHRSVYVVERLTARLRAAGRHAEVAHRDLASSGLIAPASPDIASLSSAAGPRDGID